MRILLGRSGRLFLSTGKVPVCVCVCVYMATYIRNRREEGERGFAGRDRQGETCLGGPLGSTVLPCL